MTCAEVATTAAHVHLIHVVELLGHVAGGWYQLGPVDPFSHEFVITATPVVSVVGQVLRIGEKCEIAVRVPVRIVKSEVIPSCPVSLHSRFCL